MGEFVNMEPANKTNWLYLYNNNVNCLQHKTHATAKTHWGILSSIQQYTAARLQDFNLLYHLCGILLCLLILSLLSVLCSGITVSGFPDHLHNPIFPGSHSLPPYNHNLYPLYPTFSFPTALFTIWHVYQVEPQEIASLGSEIVK